MTKAIISLFAIPLLASGCTTVGQRAAKFSNLSCDQLATALDYERRAERSARRTGAITGVASLFESGRDEDMLGLDSDFSFLEADDHRRSRRAIQWEQQRRCR
ncbi:hypothetical protein [Sphingorhabdus sp. 109]|uniref:hypothetical protein n=1 Tax=Sphingorhabdus sp. 109 TaxID=2653173 RepID=UPI0013593527|nr:hypothetical protein [Sphingorhabdus sp. 109]